jgi:hypothetical protein
MVRMLIEADLWRVAVIIRSGARVLGGSVGPRVAAMLISPNDIAGALWLDTRLLGVVLRHRAAGAVLGQTSGGVTHA